MTVKEAAKALEVSPGTVYLLCRTGRLAHHRIGTGRGGGSIRIDPIDLADFKARCRIAACDAEPEPVERPERPSRSGRRAIPDPYSPASIAARRERLRQIEQRRRP